MQFERPRGTRDYLPEECEERRIVIERIRRVFENYGYGEVITPAFEHLELLTAKAGEEVVDQIYVFNDKAGRKLGLRFELTTPIARIVAERINLPKPIRFYYIQPVWRYEEPQRGRLREFWQAGVELMGVSGVPGDAEVIAIMINALRRAGLSKFTVHVNDRRVIQGLLDWAGISCEHMPLAFKTIDKLEKYGVEYVEKGLEALVKDTARLKCLVEYITSSDPLSMTYEGLGPTAKQGIESLRELLDELDEGYGLSSYVKLDFSIVRGLDYYTSFVYEAKTQLGGEIGSVAGGGRYDDLVQMIGGPPIPATGMAIGIERLIETLKVESKPRVLSNRRGVILIPVSEEFRRAATTVAEKLRDHDIISVVDFSGRRIASSLETADKQGYRYAVIVGKREIESGQLTLRDLDRWVEKKVSMEQLLKELANCTTLI